MSILSGSTKSAVKIFNHKAIFPWKINYMPKVIDSIGKNATVQQPLAPGSRTSHRHKQTLQSSNACSH